MQVIEFHTIFDDLLLVFSNKELLHYTDLDYCESIDSLELISWVSDENRISYAGYEQGKFVGFASAHLIKKHLTASITVVVVEEFQHRGLAKELLQTLISRLFSQGMARIEAQICTENHPSIQLFESLDFTYEGTLRKNFLINGKLYDSYMYAKFAVLVPHNTKKY